MWTIYGNLEYYLNKGLKQTAALSSRVDFCVGYLNLRGWKEVADVVEGLPGALVAEGNSDHVRYCRLLVGMQKLPQEILREHFFRSEQWMVDSGEGYRMRKWLAEEFRAKQLQSAPEQ